MKPSLLNYLVCPDCKGALGPEVTDRDDDEILTGVLRCPRCGASYPILRGIPRFVQSDAYTRSFSYQWNRHRTTQVDSLAGHTASQSEFVVKTGLTGGDLTGKLVLDVGCGTGRYMEIAAGMGAEVIGVDLSFAVEAAYTNMGRRNGIQVVQADVFRLPFRAESFDVIYSIGVLHHTTSTRDAFLCLPPLLKAGGVVAIWVYQYAGEYSDNLNRVRRVTVHLPARLLYALCWIAVPMLHALKGWPLLWHLPRRIPTSDQGCGLVWDVLDTFDLWSPRYQWKHTELEVREWYEKADLADITPLPFPVSMRGRRHAEHVGTGGKAEGKTEVPVFSVPRPQP